MTKTKYVKTAAFACLAFILAVSIAATAGYQKAFATPETVQYTGTTGDSTGQALFSGGKTIMAEYIDIDVYRIRNVEIDQIDVKLRKSGSPTGNVEVGIMSATSTTWLQTFNTIAASSLTTSYTEYSFSLAGTGYLIPNEPIRVAVKYTGGDNAGNHVDVKRAFNSVTGADHEGSSAYKQYYTTSWHTNSDEDMWFELSNTFDNQDSYSDETGFHFGVNHPCDQHRDLFTTLDMLHVPGNPFWLEHPRCIITEGDSPSSNTFANAYASLSGNDLAISASTHYDDDYAQVSAMPGQRVTIYEGDDVGDNLEDIDWKWSTTNGEADFVVDNLSIGTHYIYLDVLADDEFYHCGDANLSCDLITPPDDDQILVQWTVVVS